MMLAICLMVVLAQDEAARLGVSEKVLQAHPTLPRRLLSTDPAERAAILQEVTHAGFRMRGNAVRWFHTPEVTVCTEAEIGALVQAALRGPTSLPLKFQVLAIAQYHRDPGVVEALKTLLRDDDALLLHETVHTLLVFQIDLDPFVPDLLRALKVEEEGILNGLQLRALEIRWEKHLDRLIAELTALPPHVRLKLIDTIDIFLPERSAPVMRTYLSHAEAAVRALAVSYFATHDSVDRPPGIERLLDDKDAWVRGKAFVMLRRRLPRARLLEAARGKDNEARTAAIDELVARADTEAAALVRRELAAGHPSAASWAVRLGDETLIREVGARRGQYQRFWIDYLRGLDPKESKAPLEEMLHVEDEDVLREAVRAYVETQGEGCVDSLLASEHAQVVGALDVVSAGCARKISTKLLDGAAEDVRRDVVRALYRRGGAEAVETVLGEVAREGCLPTDALAFPRNESRLRDLLSATDRDVIEWAVNVLLTSGNAEARGAVEARARQATVEEILEGPWERQVLRVPGLAERIRELASTASENRPELDMLLARQGDAEAARRVAPEMHANAFASVDLLSGEDRKHAVERALAWAHSGHDCLQRLAWLAEHGVAESVPEMVEIVRNAPDVRMNVFANVNPAFVRPLVRPLLEAKDPTDRRLACHVLGQCGAAEDRERVRPLLRDASAGVRAAAVEALRRLGAREAAGDIVALLKDPSPAVQAEAIRALGEIGQVPRIAFEDRDVQAVALRARAEGGDVECAADFVRLLERETDLSGYEAPLAALAKAKAKPATEFLRRRFARHPDRVSVYALAAAGDADAIRWLRGDDSLHGAIALLRLGLLEEPVKVLPRLEWGPPEPAHELALMLNRLIDPRRAEDLSKRWTPACWVGPTAADHARVLSELLGVPVKADASVLDRVWGSKLPSRGAFACALNAVPVLEGDGVTLYSYDAALRVFEKRLGR
ncbi:MAG: HEAT repeat domain-containing protein [Planctomycetes bacterium]|nr:HEAT repeat domain-containing protein [Planctomycetota bacterium]